VELVVHVHGFNNTPHDAIHNFNIAQALRSAERALQDGTKPPPAKDLAQAENAVVSAEYALARRSKSSGNAGGFGDRTSARRA
jgi:hypothetical protein